MTEETEPRRSKTRALPELLEIACWEDESEGLHTPTSQYVELHWLPKLGPTATFAYRRLGLWAMQPTQPLVHTPTLAAQLGLRESISANSPLARSVHRLVMFHVARWEGDVLYVRPKLWSVPSKVRAA